MEFLQVSIFSNSYGITSIILHYSFLIFHLGAVITAPKL